MLAEEYKLIDISLISYSPGWTNKAKHQNILSSALTLLMQQFGLTNHGISAQQKALAVSSNTMKTLKIIFFLLTLWSVSYGQDGSDIKYFRVYGVDTSLVGQFIHFDFFRRSFGGRTIDTVTISIDNRPLKFIERRKDNGYDNWFSQQYLQSIDKIDKQTIRISKFRLDSISANSFLVTMYVDLYDSNNKLHDGNSRQVKYRFDKKDITEVLVKSKQR